MINKRRFFTVYPESAWHEFKFEIIDLDLRRSSFESSAQFASFSDCNANGITKIPICLVKGSHNYAQNFFKKW
jgi:hypothetical protein